MSYEITAELIERLEPNPPCNHCENGSIDEIERGDGEGNTVTHSLCTSCWMTTDGEWFLPPKRTDDVEGRHKRRHVRLTADHHRPQYRGSGRKIMNGAHQAYNDVDENYDTDDGSASFERFVSA